MAPVLLGLLKKREDGGEIHENVVRIGRRMVLGRGGIKGRSGKATAGGKVRRVSDRQIAHTVSIASIECVSIKDRDHLPKFDNFKNKIRVRIRRIVQGVTNRNDMEYGGICCMGIRGRPV